MEWPRYPLREVAPASRDRNSLDPGDTVWHLGLDQIESHTGVVVSKHRAPVSAAGNSTFQFDQSHVLYSKLRPYLNKVVVPDEAGIATTELIPLQPHPHLVCREFLAYYLRSPVFLAYASQFVTGAKMPRVILDKFWAHEISLPPLSEQRRIVEILDQADRFRRLRGQADAKAERILPALFIKMFGDPWTNPRRLPIVELESVILEGPQNGLYKPASTYGRGTKILRIDGFYGGEVSNLNALKRLKISPEEIAKYGLEESDIVVNRVNSEEYLGKSAIIPALPEPLVFESNMMRLAVDKSQVLPRFILAHLQTSFTRAEMLSKAKRAVNQASINQQDVRSLTLLRPPLEDQKKFVAASTKFQEVLFRYGDEQAKLESFFDSLLHRAFSGTLTASWRKARIEELVQEMEQQAKALPEVAP